MADENSPLELVLSRYQIPIEKIRDYQIETINDLGPLPRAGHYLDQGLGKTLVATIVALYKMMKGADVTLCLVPPILVSRWVRWLNTIPGVSVITYEGTPAQREKIGFNADFVVMSLQIFKLDYERIHIEMGHREIVIIVDEASSIKNAGSSNGKAKASANHRLVNDLVGEGNHFLALTGTPISSPIDAYAFCKLVAPGTYRNLRHFENTHIAGKNSFGAVTSWKNLDLLAANMQINSKRFLRQEVLPELPEVTFDPMYYKLDDKHMALYRKLAEEQLLPLENSGGKIDATIVQRLHNCLQQIVVNYDYFSDNPANVSKTFDLLDEVLQELGDRKLIIFAKFRMTNKKITDRLADQYGAVAVYGEISQAQQVKNVDRFISDPKCRVLVGNPGSLGYGVDGLQAVCYNMLFVELPNVPRDFHQAVARIWRSGQGCKSHIRIAVAQGTLQMRKLRTMLQKDELVGQVQRNYQDLRAEIFGG